MPRYDFRCKECHKRFTLTYPSIAAFEQAQPACPHCSSANLSRVIRRVNILTSEEARLERLADPDRLAGWDEDDPRAMGRLMREMDNEMGEEADPEMHEVIERLEAGESPEAIEESLGLDAEGGLGAEGDL